MKAEFTSSTSTQEVSRLQVEPIKIAVMSSWNTDSGVSRHITPLIEGLRSQGYEVKIFSHYKEFPHGQPLNVEDEAFVTRCYTTEGKKIKGFKSFNSKPLLRAIEEEGYSIFLVEDLGQLPMVELLKIFPRIKAKAKTILLNHDNKPKPNNSPFWKFEWDAIVNFLLEQTKFMSRYYNKEKIHLIDFPSYQVLEIDKSNVREKLGLPRYEKIIITFGEYNFVVPFRVLYKLRKEDLSIHLVALVYTKKEKQELENKIKKLGYNKGYDEIRVEGSSSWRKRAEYVGASDIVILDKGEGVKGEGAILSSTAYQIIGWGTPILARDNRFFGSFNGGEIVKYENNSQLKNRIQEMFTSPSARESVLRKARKFAYTHTPERISTQLMRLFMHLITQEQALEKK